MTSAACAVCAPFADRGSMLLGSRPLGSARSAFSSAGRATLRTAAAAPAPPVSRCRVMSANAAQGPSETKGSDTATKQKYELKTKAGPSRYMVSPGQRINVATAGFQALARFGSAAFVNSNIKAFKNRPAQPLEIYEFEGCPFCRKVREACSDLDVDVKFYPCPKGGPNFRPKAGQKSGKSQFPFLVDPNTGREMLESDAIIQYLYNTYGDGNVPLQFKLGPLTTLTCGIAMLPRAGKGTQYRRARMPEKPIDIWGYEASPFCKLARETLVELEIPHVYHTVARNSPKRPAFEQKWGVFQVPYIEDPNTGIAMFETESINKYLEETYAL